MTRRIEAALLALVLLFTAAVVVGEVIVKPTDRLGSPSQSRLRVVEDVFPPRQLTTGDIRRGGRTCLQGGTLVVNPGGGGCTFIVPDGVHLVVFRRVPTSSSMTVTLSQTGDLTQTVDTGRPGPDPRDPLQLRFAVVENGTTVTLSSCQGPAGCHLEVAG